MANDQSIDERLLEAQVATSNAMSDPEILAALTELGYNAEKITAGKNLTEEVANLIFAQKKEYGEQYEATETVKNAWTAADKAYMKTLKIARIALRDNVKAQNALALTGIRKKSISGWLEQAEVFYRNLLGDEVLIALMTGFGYTAEKLQAEQALVSAVREANATQEKEKGEAQEATENRDRKVDLMDRWMADFKAIVRIALVDHPQWLDKLGL